MSRAAILIQRAYRRHLERKAHVLISRTIAFQALARGYLFRVEWRRKALRNAFVGQKRGYWN